MPMNAHEYHVGASSVCAFSVAAWNCSVGMKSFSAASVIEIAEFHAPKPTPTNKRTTKIGKYSRLNATGCLYARNVIPVMNATMRLEMTADSNWRTPNVEVTGAARHYRAAFGGL